MDNRNFVWTLAVLVYVPLMLFAILNVTQDAFGVFNFPRIIGYNHFISDEFYRSDNSDDKMNRIIHHIQTSSGPKLIIGTSRVLWGVNTCSEDGLDRAGLYGLSISNSFQLIYEALESNKYSNIYVELASVTNFDNSVDSRSTTNMLKQIIGLNTLKVSLSNLLDSVRYKHLQKINCYSYSTASHPINANNPDIKANEQPANDVILPKNIGQIPSKLLIEKVEILIELCSSKVKSPVELVFFNSPVSEFNRLKEHAMSHEFQSLELMKKLVLQNPGSCQIQVKEIDYSIIKSNILSDKQYWGDAFHFNEKMGELIVSQLSE